MDILHQLERFSAINGPDFYGIPYSDRKVTLKREAWMAPRGFRLSGVPTNDSSKDRENLLVPFWAGQSLNWKFID